MSSSGAQQTSRIVRKGITAWIQRMSLDEKNEENEENEENEILPFYIDTPATTRPLLYLCPAGPLKSL